MFGLQVNIPRRSCCFTDFLVSTSFQASEEYREHSTHKTQRARKTQQRQNQHVVEQRSTTLQESSIVTTKRSSQQELSKKNFNVIRLNSIPLPLASGGTVTCKYHLSLVFRKNFLKFSSIFLTFFYYLSHNLPKRLLFIIIAT